MNRPPQEKRDGGEEFEAGWIRLNPIRHRMGCASKRAQSKVWEEEHIVFAIPVQRREEMSLLWIEGLWRLLDQYLSSNSGKKR